MQTNSIKGKSIGPVEAVKELGADMSKFGLKGIFRGQGIGIAKVAPLIVVKLLLLVVTAGHIKIKTAGQHALKLGCNPHETVI